MPCICDRAGRPSRDGERDEALRGIRGLNGEWRWRLWSADRRIIASSAESFDSQKEARRAAIAVKHASADAYVEERPGIRIRAALRLRALPRATPSRCSPVAEETGGTTPVHRLIVHFSIFD